MKVGSFTVRFVLQITLLLTGTTAAVLFAGGVLLRKEMIRSLELLHEAEYDELNELLGSGETLTGAQIEARIRADTESDAALYYTQVHRADGEVLFRSPNLGDNLLPDLSGGELHWTVSLPGVGDVRVSEFHNGPWHIQIASPLEPQQRLMGEYVKVGGGLVAGVALAGIVFGYGFARVTLRPVRAIEHTARRIRGDNLGERIPVPAGDDELAALVRLLNETFGRLEASFEQVRRFTADASHELKTPLALMRLSAERLRAQVGTAPAVEIVDDLLEEIGRMHRMIESLLFLAKADAGVLPLERKPIEVGPWLRDFAEDASVLAEDRGVEFALGPVGAGTLHGEASLLRQLLLNLVSNALQVTPPRGRVVLTAVRSGREWTLVVEDEGPGLADDKLARVFERFVRFEHDAPSAEGGHGLGLAICRGIANLHGGTLNAENRRDRPGLRMILTLPEGT
jgi:signal transduction histidine kinase